MINVTVTQLHLLYIILCCPHLKVRQTYSLYTQSMVGTGERPGVYYLSVFFVIHPSHYAVCQDMQLFNDNEL